MNFDWLAASFHQFVEQWHFESHSRDLLTWVFLFAPLLVMLEVPRYYFASWGVLIATWLGYPRRDRVREEAFLAQAPMVSVIVAGRNESETIERAIRSLLDQDYPNYEVIVVDDCSTDDMYDVASRWSRRGRIRLLRNTIDRTGRPGASNVGVRFANGEFVLSVDADTTFDRDMISQAMRPFADPEVGVVAGNVLVSNRHVNLLARLQALEYAVGIDLRKRWTNLSGCTLQASGAIGGFRRAAVARIGGWDPELAEDTDISLRLKKEGYKVVFAPDAVAYTFVPDSIDVLLKQRTRWDRGTLRTYFRKHAQMMNPLRAGWAYATELWSEYVLFLLASLIYPIYLVCMMIIAPWTLLFAVLFCLGIYTICTLSVLPVIAVVCKRVERPWALLGAALITPVYKEMLRWERIRAILLELFWVQYEDSFLPDSAWKHAPRF